MLGCCEIAVVLAIANVISLAVFAGYTVKLKEKQLELEKKEQVLQKEIQEVERVNGKEKQDIKELQREMKELKEKLNNSPPPIEI